MDGIIRIGRYLCDKGHMASPSLRDAHVPQRHVGVQKPVFARSALCDEAISLVVSGDCFAKNVGNDEVSEQRNAISLEFIIEEVRRP
jgi:hypothetical protein